MVNMNVDMNTTGTFNMDFTHSKKKIIGNMGIVNATSNNYNDLANKPSINGIPLVGNKTSYDLDIVEDKNFVFIQRTASDIWYVQHNLDKFPSVIVVDSGGSVVVGEIDYIDENNVKISFTTPFSGKAFCN